MATILIVDDLSANRTFLATLLGHHGHRMLEAANGSEGLTSIHNERPDLVITDVLMPVMDGWEFLKRLKQAPDLRRIPVVVVSIVADLNKGLSLGAAAVMQKPISRQELYASLVGLGFFPLTENA
jgi:CheY-like chemotaxis protein